MEIYHWQSEQGRWFLHEYPHHSWSHSSKTLRTFGIIVWSSSDEDEAVWYFRSHHHCPPIVEEHESNSTNPRTSPIVFATSVLRGLRRTLEEVAGAIDSSEVWTDCGRGVPCAEACKVNLDKFHTMKSLDCHLTPSWWLRQQGRVDVHEQTASFSMEELPGQI